ncbi:12534_t:CDS:2 [Acaulospora morrowiae]|uniref:12534_t:CDS:1 n=1 Tax=Acaulospora morrowiae TaxID=94023 RepID=A0A9N9BFR0_9GLOM|nr:12534_t:CDS:2 [Acaulospora morrowiae]
MDEGKSTWSEEFGFVNFSLGYQNSGRSRKYQILESGKLDIGNGASFSSFNRIGEKQESKNPWLRMFEDPVDALFWALPVYNPHVPRLCAQRDTCQVFAKPSRFAVFQYQIPDSRPSP